MALVQIPPTEARVRWDRAANRPAEIRWSSPADSRSRGCGMNARRIPSVAVRA